MQLIQQKFNLAPSTFSEAQEYARLIANSSFAPKDFKGKPGDVLVAMQLGYEIGLQPVQALQNIAVINGKPSLYGDALLAVVMGHPDFENIDEIPAILSNPVKDTDGAVCKIKRKGHALYERKFTVGDAKRAGLWDKVGPWKQYPERMLQMRARAWACRDKFADALKGIWSREEAQDIPSEKTVAGEIIDVGHLVEEAPKEASPTSPAPSQEPERITPETLELLTELLTKVGGLSEEQREWMQKRDFQDFDEITEQHGQRFIEAFKKRLADKNDDIKSGIGTTSKSEYTGAGL